MTTTTAACRIPADGVELGSDTLFPDQYPQQSPTGVVLFAHGSGSSRFSPRARSVAAEFNRRGLAAVLTDLLTEDEEQIDTHTSQFRFDTHLLTERLISVIDWAAEEPSLAGLPFATFGASTGAAAALAAAAYRPSAVWAVACRGGRPDLAGPVLEEVQAPTLLIVGGNDPTVLEFNEQAQFLLPHSSELHIVEGATHEFPEPGALEEVSTRAGDWFEHYLG